jgi:hypothetical protein
MDRDRAHYLEIGMIGRELKQWPRSDQRRAYPSPSEHSHRVAAVISYSTHAVPHARGLGRASSNRVSIV